MKTRKTHMLLAVLLIGALALLVPQAAMAAGTAACQTISNTATVDFNVGSTAQAPVTSAAATFTVGNKVNLTVVTIDGSPRTVLQGATNQVLTFTVTNNGNKTQDYALTPYNNVGGTAFTAPVVTDNFDAGAPSVYVETNGTPGYQAGADTATFIDELASDATATVYVVAAGPIPLVSNGDIAVYGLKATTHRGGSAGGAIGALVLNGETGACGEDTVFADTAATTGPDDANLNGDDSDRSAFVVSAAATLSVTKTPVVYSDPINGVGAGAKAIPGAVVTYTITVTNPAGSTATASSVTISDSLNAEITSVPPHLAFGNNDTANSPNGSFKDGATDCTGVAGQGIVIDGVCKTNAGPAGGGDFADWNVTAGNTVTVTNLTIAPNSSKVIKFQVTIQ